ncbi:MAG TPA: hypothetical protein VN649_10415 [Ramlibacter sp.]|nr:hypothetical protein [Ramlibacter sp.]
MVEGLVDGVTPELLPVEPLPIEPLLPPLVEPGPPMELVLPDVSLLLLVEPGVLVLPPLVPPPMALVLPLPVLPPMELLPPVLPGVLELLLEVEVSGAGLVTVVDELDELVGVPSRLVHAPSETAAMSASAAHEVRDAFIRKLLEGCSKVATGQP